MQITRREFWELCLLPNNAHLIRGSPLNSRRARRNLNDRMITEFYDARRNVQVQKILFWLWKTTKEGGSPFKNACHFLLSYLKPSQVIRYPMSVLKHWKKLEKKWPMFVVSWRKWCRIWNNVQEDTKLKRLELQILRVTLKA